MDTILQIQEEREKLLRFVGGCNRIFLYGAGNIAKAFIDVLNYENIAIEGLITTKRENKECHGYRVFTVEEAKVFLKESDGIILAFTGAMINEIRNILFPVSPSILQFDPLTILAMDDDIRFLPILKRWNNEFGKAEKLRGWKNWNRILVIRLDLIGDLIFTTPLLRELRRNFPDSEITLVIRKQNYFLMKNCPYLSEVILYECPFQEGELSRQCENIKEVEKRVRNFTESYFKEKKYDVVFFPRELLAGRNILDEFLLGYSCGAKIRIGKQIDLSNIYGQHLRELVKDSYSLISLSSKPMHETQYAIKMLETCGLTVKDESMELWTADEDKQFAIDMIFCKKNKKYQIRIVLGIVASVPSRTWKAENYRKLIELFYKKYGEKFGFVLMGGDDAVDAADIIYCGLKEERKIVINLVGKTNLAQTAACIEICDLYVGSNTGLLHFASAFGKPSVTLYSELSDGKPTDGDSPYRMGAWKVPHIDLVPPGGLDGCHGVCRMRFSHCINLNTVEQVEQGVLDLVSKLTV